MAIHKLATGPLVLTVTKAEQQEGQFGSQVVFDGEGDVRVYVAELTAVKQLARLNLTLESVVGKTLHMEQIKKDGKTYTNITLASAGAAQAAGTVATPVATPVTTPARSAAPALTFEEAAALYQRCVQTAITTFGVACEEAGVAVDAAALQAAAATLFIRATR